MCGYVCVCLFVLFVFNAILMKFLITFQISGKVSKRSIIVKTATGQQQKTEWLDLEVDVSSKGVRSSTLSILPGEGELSHAHLDLHTMHDSKQTCK